jgi:hypothetical protein
MAGVPPTNRLADLVLTKEMRLCALVLPFHEELMSQLNSEAMDFRPDSEFFRPIRMLALT